MNNTRVGIIGEFSQGNIPAITNQWRMIYMATLEVKDLHVEIKEEKIRPGEILKGVKSHDEHG